ncbi:chromosomal protein D1-like [Myxocyprinus asiaticus]|uniref:chromosomal protein D1-like n=1 Tax=Myxocyprinus asiaticus TaxID=70543 RepID=UPI002221B834|nr:chromosomal protein D1-like [Myxocyprinus asiaticus]XP_051527768.1 chromosomal protein D1-like [Myxocyprinus asiaticus]XP_051527769.1 chromosomal protein D1-like [Myxocyprinus asiaticus]XP_051527770.1 chromosomal protein D1-like [Myxocyprinus asiaticus]
MEVDNTDGSENIVPNGSTHPPKRGRGRPRGSLNKKFSSEKVATHNARPSKKVELFSPEIIIRSKVKKRGRPKKLKMRGRPRKIPLTPEEESERIDRLSKQRKRKLWKPLGRPRIHPVKEGPKIKRARGRPRKYETMPESSSQNDTHPPSVEISLDAADGPPSKRGRPLGSLKKRGRPGGSTKTSTTKVSDGTPRKRGRPPGSGNKVKIVKQVDGTPKKRGRPPGSSNKVKIMKRVDGTPKKRGRPPGSGIKVTAKWVGEGPRKRGRPPGSGKIKVCVPDSVDYDVGSYTAASGQSRKRGRPRKVQLASVLEKLTPAHTEEDKMENDEPSPKRSRNLDSTSQTPNETTAEDNGASENNKDPEDEEEEEDDNSDSPKVNNISEKEIEEAASSKMLSGKSKKKK